MFANKDTKKIIKMNGKMGGLKEGEETKIRARWEQGLYWTTNKRMWAITSWLYASILWSEYCVYEYVYNPHNPFPPKWLWVAPFPIYFLVLLCLFHKSTSVNHCTKKTWVSGLGLLQLNIGVNFWGRVCILITGNTCLMCWEDVCYVYVY